MALPKIDLPIYELELPSNGKKIKYRPFTVKEEKILLIAQEGNDLKQSVEAIKQVVNNCLIEDDIKDFAMFDLEYILLLLRSKSVDNNVKFKIKAPDTKEDIELELDLNDVSVTRFPDHTNRITINDTYILFLKYPTIEQFIGFFERNGNDALLMYNIMISCLDKVASPEETYKFSDFSKEDIDKFMDDLQSELLQQIEKFFDTMPKLRHEMKYKNSRGDDKIFVLEGTRSFFI
jgi:hypothetical protein